MDKIYIDPNMESDNTEHMRRKRLSSILKAPRNPLDDLGNGNEITQDIHVERRRRSSRRVSFANTINCRVFQRDLKNTTSETENTGCSADEKEDTLANQNEDTESVPCEITGMSTLLHAPIQVLGQQAEWHGTEHAAPRTDRQDTTLVFSEENEMEMTASHTAIISRNLRAHQPDRTEKIDFTSFLAKLNSSQGKAESSKELSLLSDPTNHPGPSLEQKEEATAVKKIDFNEFLLRLKSNNPAERPDKENVCCVPSPGWGDVAQPSGEFGYSHEPLDTCNVTKVFRGREGGMEMTKCEAADVKIPFPGVGEAPAEQWECADVTEAFADEGMDVTTSHTAKVSFALSTVGSQNLNFQNALPPTEFDNSVLRRASNQHLNVQQDPQLRAGRKTANAEDRGNPPVLRAGKQEARAVSAIQGSVSSETVFRGDKTVVFSKCDDMEMTENYTDIIYSASSTEESSSWHETCLKPVSTKPPLTGSKSPACGNIPKGLAPGDNPAAGPCKTSALELPMENVSQARGPAAASTGFGSYTNLVAGVVLKSRFDPSANPQLVFSGEKTVIFAGEDMDLAKTFVKDGGKIVDNEHPPAGFTSVSCKPHFLGNRSTPSNVTEQEEMEITRCHTVVFDGRSSGITAEPKQMPCKIIPRKSQNKNATEGDISAYSVDVDKENVGVRSIDGNIKRSQARERNAAQGLQMVMVDKRLGKTNFQASGLSSCAKSMSLLQEQNRGVPENVVTNTGASLPLQSQEVVVSQPLERNLPSLSDSCMEDTTGVFLGDQSMDITKAHPAAFEIAPVDTEQESNNCNQNKAPSKQLQNQPFPVSSRRGVDIVSQTAALECGDTKMNTSKQIVTVLPPSGSFTFSNNPAPSGMRGSEQFGTVIGINADSQNSERKEKPQSGRAVSKVLPTRGDSDRHFSMGEAGSSRDDLKTPSSARGLLQRGAEHPVLARTPQAPKGSSQLSFFGEKSVVFPQGENMDMTGRCVVMDPDCSTSVVLSQNKDKAAPGRFGRGGSEAMSLGKAPTMTMPAEQSGQEAAGGRTVCFAVAEDMEITRSHTAQQRQLIPAIPSDRTIVFGQDQQDMDITASHTVAVCKNILGDSDRHFSVGETGSSREDLKTSSAQGLLQRGAEHPVFARTPQAPKGSSQLSFFGEKSVVFPQGENMDMTGRCVTMDPDCSTNVVLSQNKAARGHFGQGGSETMFLEKAPTMTMPAEQSGQEAAGGRTVCFAVAEDMEITRSHTTQQRQLIPAIPADRTIVFGHDQQDMDITASHTVAVSKNILGDSDKHFSVGETDSSREDLKTPSSAQGLLQRGAEHPVLARTPQAPKGSSQLSFFGEKSVVFPQGENMDMTGRCVAMDPDCSTNVVLSQNKAAPGCFGRGGSETMSLEKAPMMTMPAEQSGQEAAGGRTVCFAVAEDMEITRSHTAQHRQPIPAIPADRTIMFGQDQQDMDITASHTVAVCKNIRGDSDRHFSMGEAGSSRDDLKAPLSAHGLLQRGAEYPVFARTPQAPKGSSQLSFFGEKSVVFPQGENMDMTGRCVTMDPDCSTSVVLSQNKAAPGRFGRGGSETMSLGKAPMMTMPAEQGGQEAAGGRTVCFAVAEDMEITRSHTTQQRQLIPAIPADRTIVFGHDQQDMDITASHTVAVSKNICGFEAQQVPHTNTQQPSKNRHGGLVPCRDEMDSSQYATKPKDKPSIPSSASSASAFPTEKGATQVPSGPTPHSIYSVSHQESTMDVGAPQDHGLPTDNSEPVSREQDLTPPDKLQSKGVSFKFPSEGPVDQREESGILGSCVAFPMQGSDPWKGHPDAPSTQRNQPVEEDSSQCGDSDSGLAGANLIPAANKESKKNEEVSAEGEAPPKDFQINSEEARQPLVSDSSGDQAHPTLQPPASGILGVCSKLINMGRKSLSLYKTASSDQLPSSSAQPEDTLRLGKNIASETNNVFDTKKQENRGLESGTDPVGMAPKDKYPGINIPLGIFQPKLPNRRNRVSSAQDINAKSDRAEAPVPANTSETPGTKSSRQNFSPFQFIAEEFLPVCLEEMDSNESVSSELVENAWDGKNKKQIPPSEKGPFEETETCNMKRALGQTEEDLQSPKKAKKDPHVDAGASEDLEGTFDVVPQDQAEVDAGGEPPNLSAKSPECPHACTSSSLDSVKADTQLTIQRSSQVESQLLTDSICEENLWEKFQSGAITVGEFFTLLQVHVVIQKPRHSQLPASCAVSAPPTAEDLLYCQYIHRPKLRIYEEDCQELSRKTLELKPHVTVLDQPLVNVIRSLWEVMRTCTDEELSKFGAELNKMKSCFTKEAKILSHNEKETLYKKLLQSAEEQYRKLQSRIEEVDERMKEAESSMAALESDSFWDEEGSSPGMAGGQNLQKELQSITAQEEELLRELAEMDAEDELDLAEMEELKKTERDSLEILKKYDFTEWELMEWSEQQAVFNFLYDSVTLTVVFGPPIDGQFFAARPSRSIISLDFESFLDEEQAPPSSCLVQRLIFQFIESRGSWQEKCPTLSYLPQALFDISLVVNRCKILGEELEFLQRWGAKFHLLVSEIKDQEVKLVFSSSAAFAKFELTLALSHDYPSAVLPFRVQTHIGNIGEKEIAAVLSRVPAGHHYLQRTVTSIHQNLLQGPR